jgi:hypothetical protein
MIPLPAHVRAAPPPACFRLPPLDAPETDAWTSLLFGPVRLPARLRDRRRLYGHGFEAQLREGHLRIVVFPDGHTLSRHPAPAAPHTPEVREPLRLRAAGPEWDDVVDLPEDGPSWMQQATLAVLREDGIAVSVSVVCDATSLTLHAFQLHLRPKDGRLRLRVVGLPSVLFRVPIAAETAGQAALDGGVAEAARILACGLSPDAQGRLALARRAAALLPEDDLAEADALAEDALAPRRPEGLGRPDLRAETRMGRGGSAHARLADRARLAEQIETLAHPAAIPLARRLRG